MKSLQDVGGAFESKHRFFISGASAASWNSPSPYLYVSPARPSGISPSAHFSQLRSRAASPEVATTSWCCALPSSLTSSNFIASRICSSIRANHSSTSCTRHSKASTRSKKELCSLQHFPSVPAALRLAHASPRLPAPPPARIGNCVSTQKLRT
jgi:hypothetical protein